MLLAEMPEVFGAVKLREHDGDAGARADHDEHKKVHEAPGNAHGGKCSRARVAADHPGVDRIVELLQYVAENEREREADQLRGHAPAARGMICCIQGFIGSCGSFCHVFSVFGGCISL